MLQLIICCFCYCRDFSRQEYLKKREEKKIEELEADLQDAEMLFAGEKLSKRELEDIEFKRTVLELAKKRKQAQEYLNRDVGYHMPTAYDKEGAAPSERYKVLTERYRYTLCLTLGCIHQQSVQVQLGVQAAMHRMFRSLLLCQCFCWMLVHNRTVSSLKL